MPKKIKLSNLKVTSFLTSLKEDEKTKIKGGGDTIYPCEISAPEIICNSDEFGYTCINCTYTCFNTCNTCNGCGGETEPPTAPQIICI